VSLFHQTSTIPTPSNTSIIQGTAIPSTDLIQRRCTSNMPGLTSASGVLGFLSDEEPELKVFALQTLNDDIDTLWTEVADSVGQM
jgi:hypothetical protein